MSIRIYPSRFLEMESADPVWARFFRRTIFSKTQLLALELSHFEFTEISLSEFRLNSIILTLFLTAESVVASSSEFSSKVKDFRLQ